MAEAVLVHKLAALGIDQDLVDSAGTGGWHVGEPPDPRTQAELKRHGIGWLTRARQVRPEDFQEFDHVIAMDAGHVRELVAWRGAVPDKVTRMMEWCGEDADVPDPYYGGDQGFRAVYAMCDRACGAIADRLYASLRPR